MFFQSGGILIRLIDSIKMDKICVKRECSHISASRYRFANVIIGKMNHFSRICSECIAEVLLLSRATETTYKPIAKR
jgi:hypothetical protein